MDERVAIVTGAAKGIGYACARRFYEDGYRVVLADSDTDMGSRAMEELGADSARAIFVECDVSDKLEVHNLVAETLSTFGRIDVLVNNAGILLPGGALDLSVEDFDRVLGINLRGAFLVSQAVVKYMVSEINEREDRSRMTHRPYAIVNMSSINDQVALAGFLAYTVSKGGIRQMTKAMALELAPYGIRVNGIGPGSVKTAMMGTAAEDAEALKKVYARTPLGRIALPDEIANVAAFLASEEASYITGEIIYVDGGRLALNGMMPDRNVLDEVEE